MSGGDSSAKLSERKRPIRIVALLDALARAGLAPSPLPVIHELAYLCNVLAPVFDLTPFSASLLKRRGGPYYPVLQQTLDRMVGAGVVVATDVRHILVPEESRYRLSASYRLNAEFAKPIIERYREIYSAGGEVLLIDELAAAYSTLADEQLGNAVIFDARYAHGDVDTNNVIDFGEWKSAEESNFSRNAALTFAPNASLLPAERLYLYLDHLKKRASNG
jgi:hypothetical protein